MQFPRYSIAAYNLVHATGTQNDKEKKRERRRYTCRMRYPMAHRYIPCKQCSRHDWYSRATAVAATGYTRFSQHNDSSPERFKARRPSMNDAKIFRRRPSPTRAWLSKSENMSSVEIHEIKK